MSNFTDEAEDLVRQLREIEFCPSVSTQDYEALIKKATNCLEELAWMRKELET